MIGPWIAETQAQKVAAQAEIRSATGQHRMTRDEIAAILTTLGDLVQVIRDPGMIGYTLPEIRRLLISLIQGCAPGPKASGPGHAGAGDASTRPGYAITGTADTCSPSSP